MKKIGLGILITAAIAGAAHAQSSIIVYGAISTGVRNVTNVDAAGNSRLSISSNGLYDNNRFGVRGQEDLGSGTDAHFVLESGFNGGTGTLDNTSNRLFNRLAYVGIGNKAWGTLDLGRNYTLAHNAGRNFDPFLYRYTGISPLPGSAAGARADNDIRYTLGLGPVTARVEYALGEVAGSTRSGSLAAGSLIYAGGPLTLGGTYTRRKPNIAAPAAAPNFRDNEHWILGAAYTVDQIRLTGGYMKETQETLGLDNTTKTAWGGINYNFTPAFQLTAAYYQTDTAVGVVDGKRAVAIVGAQYSLSKRTSLFAEIDRTRFTGTYTNIFAAPTGVRAQTGIGVGVSHFF